jgi:Flp pilus assembly CpaE family ATPase
MMTVASARGGTGKSIFATNLILSMIKQKAQACFIDYSMAAGDFFTMMDFVPRNTLVEAIAQGKEIDAQYLASLLADHSLGFSFLACPNHDFDFYSFDYESALNLLKVSRQLSPYVVVDTGVADLHSTLAAIDEADLVFLITNRDLARLLSMQRMLKLHASRGVMMEKIKIIINNAEVGTEISESEIESVLEHPVSAYLPSNPLQTTFSINSGQPLVAGKLELPLCKVIHRLSELCLNHWKD